MSKILVGIDGSAGAEQALKATAELASATGATVMVAHVVEIPPIVTGEGIPPDWVALATEAGDKVLREAADQLTQAGVSDVIPLLLHGTPAASLLDAARAHEADTIVIGHRGRSMLDRLFLGSVADRIAHRAGCTVVIAPPPPE